MSLAEYTPHILTGASLFFSIFIHWKMHKTYWKPSFISGASTALFALFLIFFLQENYLNMNSAISSPSDWGVAGFAVAGFGFSYGFIIAVLIGYVIKVSPSFFD